MSIPSKYCSDHLFLLIGANPLPNYVAAVLLTKPTGTVHLLYSDGSEGGPSTKRFANFLEDGLCKRLPDATIRCHGIHEANEGEIRNRVRRILRQDNVTGKVGLNYTGGTKPMAIHTYRALAEQFSDTVFSYLDARRLALFFDGVPTPYPVSNLLPVDLDELAALHGYEISSGPHQTPKHKLLFEALAHVHATKEGYDQWRGWLVKRPLTDLPDWNRYPALEPVGTALDTLCGGKATPVAVASLFNFATLDSCYKWLSSTWLEELVLEAIRQNTHLFDIKHYGHSLELTPTDKVLREGDSSLMPKPFELDAVAVLGYQLFVASCIVSDRAKGNTKTHLFEAYVRARQLGGDEARIALICCVATPALLQREIDRTWLAQGHIEVFGREHLTTLADYFHDWFMRMRR